MPHNEALHLLFTGFFFLFGSLLGSFSNVVILRMASGKSVIFPPSACPVCNHQLHAGDLFPVFSWLMLRGKCRYCKAPISWQYPLVEATIALIVGLSFFKAGLGVGFVVLAARMVIWFIASVIFLRNEIQRPEPFIWAIFYFVLLNFPVSGCPFVDRRMLAVPLIAAGIGFIASLKHNTAEIFQWGGLAFLAVFSLMNKYSLYVAIPLLLVAFLYIPARTSRSARILFFGMQVVAIFSNLL